MMASPKILFSKFLQEHGIFSKKQSEIFSSDKLNINDESQSIFHLADFFKALTPSNSYDLALRLFLIWKNRPNAIQNDANNVNKLVKYLDQLRKKSLNLFFDMLKLFKNTTQEAELQIQEATFRDTEGFYSQFLESNHVNDSIKNITNKSFQQIHERLYSEASSIRLNKFYNEERKVLQQLEGCTFKPVLNKAETILNKTVENGLPVFERLLIDRKNEIVKENEARKLDNEMKGCTFHPKVESSPGKIKNSVLNRTNSLENTFERLHKESTMKKQILLENTIKKQELEIEGCTFKPQLVLNENTINVTKSFDDSFLVTERIKRLHNLHSQKQIELMKMKVESEENELKKYSFKPEITKTSQGQVENKVDLKKTTKRLFDWKNEKKIKIEELKRQFEEEKEIKINGEKSKKKKNNNTLPFDQPVHDRLYKYNQTKPQKRKELEEKMLKDIGASFIPKINIKKKLSTTPTRSAEIFFRVNEGDTPKMMNGSKDFLTEFQKMNPSPRPLVPRNFLHQRNFSSNQLRNSYNNLKINDSENSFNFSPKLNSKKEFENDKKLLNENNYSKGDTMITFGNDDPLFKMRMLAKKRGIVNKYNESVKVESRAIDKKGNSHLQSDSIFNRKLSIEVFDIKDQLKVVRISNKNDLKL